jgi:hypothetical protein
LGQGIDTPSIASVGIWDDQFKERIIISKPYP